MSARTYDVVWDGTRARDPYLVAEREAPRSAPRARRTGLTDQVLDELRLRGEATMRELAAALELDGHAVNGALWQLIQRGAVVVVGEGWNAPTIRGGRP